MRVTLGYINFSKFSVGHTNYFPRKLLWMTTLFGATFVLKLIFNVLVESQQEDLEEDLGFSTHGDSTLTIKFVLPNHPC